MVYSGGVRSFIQAAAVCALALSTLPSVRAGSTSTTTVSCQASEGDKKFGIQAIVDDSCVNGGLGCFKKQCRYCKVLDTNKSKHLDTCLSHGVAFTSTTPVVVTQGPCQVSSGDVAAGISAVTDSSCLNGGLGCYNDHCRFCKVMQTPQSAGFMACSSLDSSYNVQVAVMTATTAPVVAATNAPATTTPVVDTTVPPTSPPTSAPTVTDVPTSAPTDTPTSTVTDAPTTENPTTTPTEVPTVTDAPVSASTDAPTSTPTDAPTSEAPTVSATDISATDASAAQTTCTIVPSVGDLNGGVTIVTDPLCGSGGIGCLSDVCRFCKLKTTPQSDPYMDCALVNGTASVVEVPTTTAAPDATTETPSVVVSETEAPNTTTTDAPDPSTEAPVTDAPDTATEAPAPSDASTEVPVTSTDGSVATEAPAPSDASTEVPVTSTDGSVATEAPAPSDASTEVPVTSTDGSVATEAPAPSDASTEVPVASTDDSEALAPSDASTEVPVTSTDASGASADTLTTDAPSASTKVPDNPTVVTEAPTSPTTCTLVASADDTEFGISVATDSSCKSGGVGCIDEVCRFCKVTTTIQSAPYVDCALLEDGSPKSTVPAVDSTGAPTDAVTETPNTTSETPVIDAPSTETPAVTESPVTATETGAPTTDAPAATTAALPDQPTCGIVAAAGDIAVGVHIATDATCSAGGLGCINDLCRFCKVETTPQSETFVDCSSLAVFASDSEAPVTTAPIATTKPSCELVASSGDSSVGIQIVTDATCTAGGVGCISDVCRFCKVITSIQSAAFIDCVSVDGYTPATEAPAATTSPDVITSAPSSAATCSRIASEGDFAVGVGIATDATCRAGGVGCIDDVCRFCQVTATVQSAAFVSCPSFAGYSPRTEAPVDTITTSPTTDVPIAQASCDLVVSAGDAAVGISITGDATCAAGGVGCIDTVCRFCKVATTVQSATFVDCTSIAGFTLSPINTTTPPVDSATATSAPTTSASCSLVVSEGDAAVGIDITADTSCQLGGVGCIDSVCRFCKAKTTDQSAAFVDCPAVVPSSTAPSDSTSKPVDASVSTSGASSLPADASETPVDTTATDISQTTTATDGTTTETPIPTSDTTTATTDAPVATSVTDDSITTGSDKGNSGNEVPSVAGDTTEPTEAPTTASDAIDTTDVTDVASTEASQGSVDTTSSTNATNVGTSDVVQGSTKDDNDTLTEAPLVPVTVTDTSDLLTEAPTTTIETPTKAPAADNDDVDWEGSESAKEDSDSTYDDSDESLGGI